MGAIGSAAVRSTPGCVAGARRWRRVSCRFVVRPGRSERSAPPDSRIPALETPCSPDSCTMSGRHSGRSPSARRSRPRPLSSSRSASAPARQSLPWSITCPSIAALRSGGSSGQRRPCQFLGAAVSCLEGRRGRPVRVLRSGLDRTPRHDRRRLADESPRGARNARILAGPGREPGSRAAVSRGRIRPRAGRGVAVPRGLDDALRDRSGDRGQHHPAGPAPHHHRRGSAGGVPSTGTDRGTPGRRVVAVRCRRSGSPRRVGELVRADPGTACMPARP